MKIKIKKTMEVPIEHLNTLLKVKGSVENVQVRHKSTDMRGEGYGPISHITFTWTEEEEV